jgi:hypothetical protein
VFITTQPVEEAPAIKTEKPRHRGVEIDPHWVR